MSGQKNRTNEWTETQVTGMRDHREIGERDRKYERTERTKRMSGQIGRKREQPKIQK